jgi:hypothetical protein
VSETNRERVREKERKGEEERVSKKREREHVGCFFLE